MFYTYDHALDTLAKNVIYQGPPRKNARTTEAAHGIVGRGELGAARPGNSRQEGGPQLESSRRRLKSWSKSDPSAALVQPPDNRPCIAYIWRGKTLCPEHSYYSVAHRPTQINACPGVAR